MIGIPIECLSYFGIYRLMADSAPKHAHAYRAGLFGMLIFGALTHVLCCAAVFYYRQMYAIDPATAAAGKARWRTCSWGAIAATPGLFRLAARSSPN